MIVNQAREKDDIKRSTIVVKLSLPSLSHLNQKAGWPRVGRAANLFAISESCFASLIPPQF